MGQQIIDESELLHSKLGSSPWHLWNNENKKIALLLLINTKKPSSISANNIFILEKRLLVQSVRLEPGTKQYARFEKLPFPLTYKVYIFHINNKEGVLQRGEKPDLIEKGPYVYKQSRSKKNIHLEDDDTVSFEQELKFEFDPEASTGTEDDVVTLPNPPMLSSLKLSTDIEKMALSGCMDKIFGKYEVLMDISVRDVLFKGMFFAEKNPNMGTACEVARRRLAERAKVIRNIRPHYEENSKEISKLEFSFFGFKVWHTDHEYVVKRGMDDVSELGNIVRWNRGDTTDYYGSPEALNNKTCQAVRGTDSTLYPPGINDRKYFEIFNTDICRTVSIDYVGTDEYKGIKGHRFEASKDFLRPSTVRPELDCFCTKSTEDVNGEKSCFLDGVIDLMPCLGVPILGSFPHFLHADEKYRKGVTNMNPSEEKHKIFLIIEPNVGIPLQGVKRLQMNVVLRPETNVDFMKNIKPTVVPYLWLEEGVNLPDDLVEELKDEYFHKVTILTIVKYVLIAICAVGLIISSIILIRAERRGYQNSSK